MSQATFMEMKLELERAALEGVEPKSAEIERAELEWA